MLMAAVCSDSTHLLYGTGRTLFVPLLKHLLEHITLGLNFPAYLHACTSDENNGSYDSK